MDNVDAIIEDFKALPQGFWDFKKYEQRDLVHRLHNYPAVMIYPISRNILEIIQKHTQVDTLLDPFMGSGTVLVEGQLANVKTITCFKGNKLKKVSGLQPSCPAGYKKK